MRKRLKERKMRRRKTFLKERRTLMKREKVKAKEMMMVNFLSTLAIAN